MRGGQDHPRRSPLPPGGPASPPGRHISDGAALQQHPVTSHSALAGHCTALGRAMEVVMKPLVPVSQLPTPLIFHRAGRERNYISPSFGPLHIHGFWDSQKMLAFCHAFGRPTCSMHVTMPFVPAVISDPLTLSSLQVGRAGGEEQEPFYLKSNLAGSPGGGSGAEGWYRRAAVHAGTGETRPSREAQTAQARRKRKARHHPGFGNIRIQIPSGISTKLLGPISNMLTGPDP